MVVAVGGRVVVDVDVVMKEREDMGRSGRGGWSGGWRGVRGSEDEERRWCWKWNGWITFDRRFGVRGVRRKRRAGREAARMVREGSMGAVRRGRREAVMRFWVVEVEISMAVIMEAALALR